MIKFNYDYPDFEKFMTYIHVEGNTNYLDAEKFYQIVYSYSSREETCKRNLVDAESMMFQKTFQKASRDNIKDELVSCGIPDKTFKSRKNKSGYSLDAENINAALEYVEKTKEVNERMLLAYIYMTWTREKSALSSVLSRALGAVKNGLLVPDPDVFGWNDKPLLRATNVYNQRVTGRFYPKDLSITSLPLALRQCFVAPNGTFLAGFDFRQIDLEVMYNVFLRGFNAEEDAIFDEELEDKYRAMYKIVCSRANLQVQDDYYTENRAEIKTIVLAAGYGGQLQVLMSNFKDRDFCYALREYYDSHEGYQKIVEKILTLISLGISFRVQDYFGFELDIPVTEEVFEVGETDLSEEQIIKYAISYIVQSTSNSIYTKWVNHVKDEFEAAGCTDDDIWVALSVFDEAVFCITGDALDYFYIIRNAQRIQISDWDPIRLKPEIYIHYKEDTPSYDNEAETIESIKETIEEICEANKDKIIDVLPKERRENVKLIPTVHTVHVVSTMTPKEVLKEQYGYIASDSMSEQEQAEKVEELAHKHGNQDLYDYARLYNRIVLINGETNQKLQFVGLSSLPNLMEHYGIQYVKVFTVLGDGFTVLGPACGTKISVTPSVVLWSLTDGNWGSTNGNERKDIHVTYESV